MDFVAKQSRLSTSKEKPTLSIKFDFYHETKVTQRSAGISIAVNFTLQHEDHYKGAFYLINYEYHVYLMTIIFFDCVLQSVIAALFRKVNAIFFRSTRNIIIYCLILSEYWDKTNVFLTFPGVSVGIKFKISLFSRSYVLFGCCTTGNAVF